MLTLLSLTRVRENLFNFWRSGTKICVIEKRPGYAQTHWPQDQGPPLHVGYQASVTPCSTETHRRGYHSESLGTVAQCIIFQSFSTKDNPSFRKLSKAVSNRLFPVTNIYKAKFSASLYFYFAFPPSCFSCSLTHTHGSCQGLLCVLLCFITVMS